MRANDQVGLSRPDLDKALGLDGGGNGGLEDGDEAVVVVLAGGVAGGAMFGIAAPVRLFVVFGAANPVDNFLPLLRLVAFPDAVDAALGEGIGRGDGQVVLGGEALKVGLEGGDEIGEGEVARFCSGGESAASKDGVVAEAVGWASPTWP